MLPKISKLKKKRVSFSQLLGKLRVFLHDVRKREEREKEGER